MCPWPRALVNGDGGYFERGTMCAHVLLVETPSSGLVLVDTGIGNADVADPVRTLGRPFVVATGLRSNPKQPAIEQVKALGFDPRDVRHVVPTHLDLDHAGGLPDFPWAKVHVHVREKDAAVSPPTFAETHRYRRAHFAHGPQWEPYERVGEPWKGLPAVHDLVGLPPEILAVPLPGHTRGHACIAVETKDRWLCHAGDAYFHRAAVRRDGTIPAGIRLFERSAAIDSRKIVENHARLAELHAGHRDVSVFSAHDPVEYEAFRAA